MKVLFDHKEKVANDIYSFWFKPSKPADYIAGQYTEMVLPHDKVDERSNKRWFTLSSSPTDEMLSITTKFAKPSSSFKKTLLSLSPGTQLNLAEPMGDFVLPKDPNIPLLFVAGGIGVTPFHSIIKNLIDKNEKRDIKLLCAVSDVRDLAFKVTFEQLGDNYIPIIKNPTPSWDKETGGLSAERILSHVDDKSRTLIYLAGPEPMVEKLVEELTRLGTPNHLLVTDYFLGYK